MNPVTESQNYKNITSTTTVYTGTGGMLGIFVASTTGGTLAVADGVNTMIGTFTPVAGTFYPLPARFNTSLTLTVRGTLNATVFWDY